jgi:OOP family OmpA-OmpF porin
MMKHTVRTLSLALALGLAAPAAFAQDVPGSGAFVDAKAGTAHWQAGDGVNRFTYALQGGYRWALDDRQALGLEGGYDNFGKVHDRAGPLSASVKADAWNLGANYRFNLSPAGSSDGYYLIGRAGYLRSELRSHVTVADVGSDRSRDWDNGWYAGVGVGRDFTPHFGLTLAYDFHRLATEGDHLNIGATTLGAEYRF